MSDLTDDHAIGDGLAPLSPQARETGTGVRETGEEQGDRAGVRETGEEQGDRTGVREKEREQERESKRERESHLLMTQTTKPICVLLRSDRLNSS